MRRPARLGLVLVLAGGPVCAGFITDKLAVGLYSSPGDESPERVLTSGTPTELVDRAGELCKVRTGRGEQGWLECRYLTDDKPARTMLVEEQAQAGNLRAQLAEMRARLEQEQARAAVLERRARAAEALYTSAGQNAGSPSVTPPGPCADTTSELHEGEDSLSHDFMAAGPPLAFALGALCGFAVGAVLLWRCRWRYRGLRI
jgi:hypothetical protein